MEGSQSNANRYIPILRTAAMPRTTAIGCLRQNSWSCGEKACFLLSKWTDGVGGNSCSRVKRCAGQSGGDGGGASHDSTEHGAGGSLLFIVLQMQRYQIVSIEQSWRNDNISIE